MHGRVDHVVDVGYLGAEQLALLLVRGKLQVRLPHDMEDARVGDAGDVLDDFFGLLRQLLQPFKIGAVDFDGVVPLDAGDRLHDVVADVLRERPFDAGDFAAQFGIHVLDDFLAGADLDLPVKAT